MKMHKNCLRLAGIGTVTTTTERCENGEMILSRTDFTGCVYYILLNAYYTARCLVWLRLGLGLDSVSGWLAVTHSGAVSIGHGRPRDPHFYKWPGTGGTVSRRTANKKLTKLY